MRVSSLLLCAACALAFAPPPAAADQLDEIAARGVLRVGTTGDYKPFSFKNPVTGQYEGLDIELAGRLAQSLGVKLEWIPTSWPTLMADLKAGKFDIAAGGISVTLERQKQAQFSLPYLRDGKTPITRCENQRRFQTLEQIDQPGVRVIVNPGGTNERFDRARLQRAQIVVYPDNVTIFELLRAGKADLMITDATEARLQQQLQPGLCAVHPDQPFDFSEKAYLLPNDWRWKSYVDQWLRQLQQSGSYARAEQRWLAWPWLTNAPHTPAERLLTLMDERLKLMADVARNKWNSKSAIEDLPREQAIIASLGHQAAAAGVPENWAQEFFRAQITAAKTVQTTLFKQWEASHQGRFEDAPDLQSEIRPRLDALTPLLIAALAENWPALRDPTQRLQISTAAEQRLSTRWGRARSEALAGLRLPNQ
jgi:chorismate mutase-like protein